MVRAAYGMADLEHDVPITLDTIFEAGSVSKQFTAAAVLLLARDGKLSLDDKVRKYIPEMPDVAADITIRQMLNHTAGLRDWGGLGGDCRLAAHDAGPHARARPRSGQPPADAELRAGNAAGPTAIRDTTSRRSWSAASAGCRSPTSPRTRIFEPLGMRTRRGATITRAS